MPQHLVFGFGAIESGLGEQRRLGEVELILPTLVPECGKQLAVQGLSGDDGSSAADVEYTVLQLPSGQAAEQIAGGKPQPWGGEIPAPVLIGVSIAGFRVNRVFLALVGHGAGISGFHSLGVPVHVESLHCAERLRSAVSNVERHLLVQL